MPLSRMFCSRSKYCRMVLKGYCFATCHATDLRDLQAV
jgi:hypothetical protein